MKPTLMFCLLILASMMLAGCSLYFTPEAAASAAVLSSRDPNFQIDTESVKIHQTLPLGTDSAVVVISYQGTRNETGAEHCIYSYKVEKSSLGWQMSTGGGGCQTRNPGENLQPIEIGAGQSGISAPGDPGFSQAYGAVNQADIVKVRVIWSDDETVEVDVVADSYVATRSGLFDLKRVEGLNDQGEVVYNFSLMPTTEKEN